MTTPTGEPMTDPVALKAQLLEILNRNLTPWEFTGDEPFTQELLALVDTLQQQHGILDHVVGSIGRVLCHEPVSDFDASYAEVRGVLDLQAQVETLTQERDEMLAEATILQAQIDDHYIPRVVEAESRYDRDTGTLGNKLGEVRAEIARLRWYVRHKGDCPLSETWRLAHIRHFEWHDGNDDWPAPRCGDSRCVAWAEAGEHGQPSCTCGLTAPGETR